MSVQLDKDFLSVTTLSSKGEFKLTLPVNLGQKQVLLEVKQLSTRLPVPKQKADDLDEFESIQNYKCVKLDPQNLLSEKYGYLTYLRALERSGESYVKTLVEEFNSTTNDFANAFDAETINSLYNEVKDYDVMVFLEYGMYLNTASRLKLINSHKTQGSMNSINHGMHSFSSSIYCYDVGFKFDINETGVDPNESFMWNVFTNEHLSSKNDYGIRDMIKHALFDFGGRELSKFPLTNVVTLKREGYGFMLHFIESETYLSCSVVSGKFPYVVTENDFSNYLLNLTDRDYEGFSSSQTVIVMRKTRTRVLPEDNEYTYRSERCGCKNFSTGNKFRSTSAVKTEGPVKSDLLFDCPFNTQPFYDVFRNGVSTLLPPYGGFSLIYSMYFDYLYCVNFENIDSTRFFITPVSLFYFIMGTGVKYRVVHGMFSGEMIDEKYVFKSVYNYINPEYNEFNRLIDFQVHRNRSERSKLNDVLDGDYMIILEVLYGGTKFYINDDGFSEKKILQNYLYFLEEYPSRDSLGGSVSYYPALSGKPIFMDQPFTFVVNPRTTVLPSVIRFKFLRIDDLGKIREINFETNDVVSLKGSLKLLL